MRVRLALVAIFAAIALAAAPQARAADFGVSPPPAEEALGDEAIREELTRYAVLYSLRAAFDVMDRADIPAVLAADLVRFKSGPSPEAAAELARDLTAEGSYAIVSLRYLVAFGGANWPTDRDAATYERDATLLLDGIQTRWLDAVGGTGDVLVVAREIDRINGWTEGYSELPEHLDRFAGIEAMVDEVLTATPEQAGV